MKVTYILAFLLLSSIYIYAQPHAKPDTVVPAKGNVDKQIDKIKDNKVKLHSDVPGGSQPKKSASIDSTKKNRYGDLLCDDPEYNKRSSWWKPAVEITGFNALINIADRSALQFEWARTDYTSWKSNVDAGWPWGKGWVWDDTRFGNDFILHPWTGAMYYSSARSYGYNIYLSTLFTFAGSYEWKLFGENIPPERNSLFATTLGGEFLGEVLYRLSSDVLDDRTSGSERVWREIIAGFLNPMREFNRLMDGKAFRHTNKEVYEKEPLNITIFAGIHKINNYSNETFGSGPTAKMLNLQVDYGNPFEVRTRNPFDFYRLRAEMDIGDGRKFISCVTGYGILFGENLEVGKMSILLGGFQYYDYWDNLTFELSTFGFGGGAFSKLPLGGNWNLYTNIHLALVPFGANNNRFGPEISQVRDFNFGDGAQGMFESTINLGKYATASLIYYYYVFHTYAGVEGISTSIGNNFIGIFKPRVTVNIYKNVSAGFEEQIYYDIRQNSGLPRMNDEDLNKKYFFYIIYKTLNEEDIMIN